MTMKNKTLSLKTQIDRAHFLPSLDLKSLKLFTVFELKVAKPFHNQLNWGHYPGLTGVS